MNKPPTEGQKLAAVKFTVDEINKGSEDDLLDGKLIPVSNRVIEVLDFAHDMFVDETNVINCTTIEEYLNKLGLNEEDCSKHAGLIFNSMIIIISKIINRGFVHQSIYDKVAEALYLFYNISNGIFTSAVRTLAYISTRAPSFS